MSISALVSGWATWNKLRGNDDDDWVDRLNHIYTVVLLLIFALFTGGGQYAGDPIQCWMPAEFKPTHEAYTKSYCWVQNTYYVPMKESIARDKWQHVEQEISYYQWMPLILIFMALLFKLPNVLWRTLSPASGVCLHKVVDMTNEAQDWDPARRDEICNHLALYIDKWLKTNREYHWNFLVCMRQKVARVCCLCNRREGTFLTGLYMMVKAVYVGNVIAQFFLLNAFLGNFFSWWGIEAMQNLAKEHEMKESRRFPRISLCDVSIRDLQTRDYTIQCVLPVNLFNEKIFVFLWFWYVLVATITCASFLFWCWRALMRKNRARFVQKYLTIMNKLRNERDKKACKKFADHHLRDDGIFLLRIVEKNSNDIMLSDVIVKLWDIYIESRKIMSLQNGQDGEKYAI